MANKRIILLIGVLFLLAGAIGYFLLEHEHTSVNTEVEKTAVTVNNNKETKVPETIVDTKKDVIKADLYTDIPNYIPYASVAEVLTLTPELKQKTGAVLELSQGCYFLKQTPKGIFIILQNPVMYSGTRYSRHNLQIADIEGNGTVKYKDLGYSGQENEIESAVLQQNSDEWVFDESTEPLRPLKHVSYDKKKKVIYSEKWNYDDSDPVKYEMTNSAGNVVSVMKETPEGDSGYRLEHIFYDDEGKTIRSMTADYDGENIKWFSYYDSQTPDNSVMIESVYEDGIKTEEKVYNQNFKVEKMLKATQTSDGHQNIKVMNAEGEKIMEFEN